MPTFGLYPLPMRHLSLLLCLIGGFATSWLPAQSPQKVQTIAYRNGRLQGELPYGRNFAVEGLTLQPGANMRAGVVELIIYPETNRKRRIRQQRSLIRKLFRGDQPVAIEFADAPYYQSFWWWTPDKDSTRFSFYIDRPLQLDTYYQFELNFYHRYRIEDALTQQIVDSVKRSIFGQIQRQNKLSVRIEDIETALNQAVRAYTAELEFGYLETTKDNRISFDRGSRQLSLPLEKFSAETSLLIGRVIQQEQILADLNEKISSYQADSVAPLQNDPQVQGLLTRLDRAYQQDILQLDPGTRTFDAINLEALRNFLARGDVSFDPFPALIAYAQSSAGQQTLEPVDQRVLQALKRNYFTPLSDLAEARIRYRNRIASVNERLGEGGLDRLIGEGFVLANSASFINTPFSQPRSDQTEEEAAGAANPDAASNQRLSSADYLPSTGYNAINIGTTYGVGLVGLNFPDPFDLPENPFDQVEPNLITYLAAKFYFNRIDRARFIDEPYPLFRDRFSMLLGIRATGRLTYRGQEYGNVIGVQPVTGLCLDLNRNMSLDLGLIFFSEPSLSPLEDTQRLRMAPFIGLSLDANAFNFVRRNLQNTGLAN